MHSAPMAASKCAYCGNTLTDTTPNEHIIPESLGGRAKSRRIACPDCNHKFGEDMDSYLANWEPVVWCRSLFLLSGKKGHVPGFGVVGPDGRQLRVGPGLRPDYMPSPPIVEETASSFRIVATARSRAEAERQARRILERKRARMKGVWANLKETWEVRSGTYAPASELHSEVTYDPALLCRSAAKICFDFAVLCLPDNVIRAPCFDAIREYILAGTTVTQLRPAQLEYRPTLRLPRAPDSLGHRVALSCSRVTRSAVALLELFGKLRWAVVLSWSYDGPETSMVLVQSPTRPGKPYSITEEPIVPVPVQFVLKQSPATLKWQEESLRGALQELSIATSTIAAHDEIRNFLGAARDALPTGAEAPSISRVVSAFATQTNVLLTRYIAERMARTFARELLDAFPMSQTGARTAAVREVAVSVQRAAYGYSLAFMLRVVLATRSGAAEAS